MNMGYLAAAGADEGINLFKFLAEQRAQAAQNKENNLFRNKELDLRRDESVFDQESKNRTQGQDALSFLARQRQAAVGPSRTRLRDSFLFGGV
jgi:hypothetical protein